MTQERFEWLVNTNRTRNRQAPQGQYARRGHGQALPPVRLARRRDRHVVSAAAIATTSTTSWPGRIATLGVSLPPRLIQTNQNLENFFRIHGRFRPPEPAGLYRLIAQAEALRLSRGFEELLCLEELDVEHYQHQIETALKALNQMRGRALLADEVGLGKTIEAGIIMKELIQRGLVRTVLVLTPASLTEQWREELQTKFHEEFAIVEKPAEWQALANAEEGRWLVSLDRAKLKRHSEGILARDYDLLIVDEAHKLKNRSTLAWKFVNQIRKRYVLMLTATPIQNDLMELYSLITILTPGQLGTVRGFRQHFLQNSDTRRPKNAPSLRRLLNDVMIRNRRSKVDISFPRRRAAIYHLSLSEPEWRLYADVTDYIRRRFRATDSDKHLRLTLMTLQRELSSSPQAVAATLRKMVQDTAHGARARDELIHFLELAEAIPVGRKLHAVREHLAAISDSSSSSPNTARLSKPSCASLRLGTFRSGLPWRHGHQPGERIRCRQVQGDSRQPGVCGAMVSTESGAEGRNLQFCHISQSQL